MRRRRVAGIVLVSSIALLVSVSSAGAVGLHSVADVDLEGISCPSASTCWAVGVATSGPERYHGAIVKLVAGLPERIQYVGTEHVLLFGVACTGPEACISVGEGPAEQGEIVVIAGGVAGAPQSVGSPGWSLGEISCASPSTCWAVGNNGGTLVQIEGGKPTTERVVPGIVTFDDISCGGPVSCVALGAQSLTTEVTVPIISGEPANGAILGPNLDDLSCPPGGSCELVGNTYPNRPLHALIASLRGVGASPAHKVPPLLGLSRVSCPTSRVCEAIGYGGNDGVANRGAAVTIIEGSARAPRLMPTGDYLNAVSCGSPSSCVAIGNADHGRHEIVDVLQTGA